MTSAQSPCFVIGTGRCGSTLLSEFLRMHPDVLSLSEFFAVLGGERIFGHDTVDGPELERLLFECSPLVREYLAAAPIAEVLRSAEQLQHDDLPLLLVPLPHLSNTPELLAETLRAEVRTYERAPIGIQFERVFAFLARQLGRLRWVERSGSSIDYAESVRRHWPGAKCVFMLRGGLESAYSMSRHPVFRARVARLVHRDSTLPISQCLSLDIPLHRFGAYWSALMVKMQRIIDASPNASYILLQYERLTQTPEDELRSLWRWLEVAEPPIETLQSMRAKIRSETGVRGLSSIERNELERTCRPGMRILEHLVT